ncbi:MAG TPA: DUF1146 family protein [Lactobacillaceae bacterium]|jgi:uncharacterized integral membrane protein (TIGR02327 family)
MTIILNLTLNLIMIYVAFWALGAFDWTKMMKQTPQQTLVLRLLLAIVIGYLAASFFVSYIGWTQDLPSVFWPKQ